MVRRLLYLMGLAVLGVVLYHASGWGYIAMFWWTDRYLPVAVPNFDQFGGISYFSLRVVEQLATFSIAAFLFVSGFFQVVATGQQRETIAWRVVLVRIKNLVIPYLLWSCLMLGLEWLQGRSLGAAQVLRLLLTGGATEAFYFIPLLVQYYLLAPLLIPLARRHATALLLGAGLLQIVVTSIRLSQLLGMEAPVLHSLTFLSRSWLFTTMSFWFVLGLVFGFHQQEIKPWLVRWRWLLLAGLGVLFLSGIAEWEWLLRLSGQPWLTPVHTLLDQLYVLLFLAAFIGFEQLALPGWKFISQIGTRSFGFYLAQSLVLAYLARLIYHFIPALLGRQWLFFPVLVVAGLALPWLGMEIVARSPLRRFYSFIFG